MSTDLCEESEGTVRVITKHNDPSKQSSRKLAVVKTIVCVTTILAALATYFYFSYDSHVDAQPSSDSKNLVNYVFPNTSLIVLLDTDTAIQGEFTVNNIRYEFAADLESLSFMEMDSDPMGLTMNFHNDTSPKFVLSFFAAQGMVYREYTTEVSPGHPANESVLDRFMRSVVAEHFVELSAKLGGTGYIGPHGQHLQNVHRFAQWIYQYETEQMEYDDSLVDEQWENMTEEFEKVNAIVSASAKAGYWVQSMDDLLAFTSDEFSTPRGRVSNGRSLLGNCGSPYSRCGNSCYGMCGKDCSCWSWVCGDCECWKGCLTHDYYCSCGGLSEYCCVNVFWVKCDSYEGC